MFKDTRGKSDLAKKRPSHWSADLQLHPLQSRLQCASWSCSLCNMNFASGALCWLQSRKQTPYHAHISNIYTLLSFLPHLVAFLLCCPEHLINTPQSKNSESSKYIGYLIFSLPSVPTTMSGTYNLPNKYLLNECRK